MNRKSLAKEVARKAGLTTEKSMQFLNAFCDTVLKQMEQGERIQITGFGAFEARKRTAHPGRNPQTGEYIEVPETRTPRFYPGKVLKQSVK